jgi:hypothetical protein
MKEFIIYNSDGKILSSGICTDVSYSAKAGEGEFIMEGAADPDTQKIQDGAVVDIPIDNATVTAELTIQTRQERNNYLSWCDWTQGADSPLDDSKKAEWATFRQALRDLSTHSNWPDLQEDDWPTEPT